MLDEVLYADAGGVQVAYRVMGDPGSVDVVVVSGAFFPAEALLEDRVARRFLEGLGALGRLVSFDKRGVGLSDPFVDWSRPARLQWADDLVAVIEAATLDQPTVVSWDPFGIARAAVAARPDAVGRLVLVNPVPSASSFARARVSAVGEDEASGLGLERLAFPSRIGEPGFQEWLERAGRRGASPTVAERLWGGIVADLDALTPEGVDCPTLVLHRADCMASEEEVGAVAAAIPGAEFVQVAGVDVFPIAGDVDAMLAEIARFVTGSTLLPTPQRTVSAVLFTDLVASTDRAAAAGDERWRDLLDAHDSAVRSCVERAGGEVVKFTGDGVLAVLPSAMAAVEAARGIGDRLATMGLGVRSGVHVGDIDRRGDDVSGLAVNVAARIMGEAAPGETLVSESVRLASFGSRVSYTGPRAVKLKGVPGRWQIWNVTD